MCVARHPQRALPSRKHFGRAYVGLKIPLSLETSSKNRRFFGNIDQQNAEHRLQSSLGRGGVGTALDGAHFLKIHETSSKFQILPF